MLKLLLLSRRNAEVARLEVDPTKVVDAACVIYQGRYFIYSGMEGRFYSTVKFVEVDAPVKLD